MRPIAARQSGTKESFTRAIRFTSRHGLRGTALIQPDGASGDCTKSLVLLFKALKAIADKVHRRFETVNLLVEIRGDMPRV